uniref:NADH dehydrogenase subunit 6 n=1 Tax=Alnetoidia dujuanensis TaxID=3003389 RepID=A0A9E8YFB2_9HEMI|nr:NADH dehydrogenase subunit 6 [Alnetoidia dujuanensis]WAJ60481.1 NADH dehydrogenase subunit 6 [Alnetoidia dujuanensis]
MKMMIMKMMMMISMLTPMLKNPMSMGLFLMLQTIMMIMFINKIMHLSWFTMITFLMMIGGLLIIFSYMSSIASNEKFKIKLNLTLILVIMLLITDDLFFETQINETEQIQFTMNSDLSLTKIYNTKSMVMTIMLVIYLLITMISVSKMVSHHKGPLRSYNK